jgi:Clp amino terminal domain, pathogenicity island component/ClpX C4-type zinc finger
VSVDERLLREARETRDRLLELQHEAERARADHHHAIRRLHAAGASMREIAEGLGLSHQRIHQIVDAGATPEVMGGRKGLLGRLAGRGEAREPGASEALERFAAEARAAFSLAQDEARALNHNYLGTEHMLLGLLGVERGVAARILSSLGVGLPQVRTAVEHRLVGRGASAPPGALAMTPRSKKALELALKEAKKRRSMVGGEHLLLGIVRVRSGLAAGILRELGVDEEAVRSRLRRAECRCSFCGLSGLEVDHLVAGPGVFICDRCVEGASMLGPGKGTADPSGRLTLVTGEAGTCGFCGKSAREVERLVAGPEAVICNACLALCREIQDEELSPRRS